MLYITFIYNTPYYFSMEMSTDNKNIVKIPKQMNDEEINENYKALNKWRNDLQIAQQNRFFPSHCGDASSNWGSCAIGSRLQIENPSLAEHIRGSNAKKYLTPEAYKLGMSFDLAIRKDQPEKASELFEKIQRLPYITKGPDEHYHWWQYLSKDTLNIFNYRIGFD